jgi:hypothetical protein
MTRSAPPDIGEPASQALAHSVEPIGKWGSVANHLFHSFSYCGCRYSSGDRDVQGQAF